MTPDDRDREYRFGPEDFEDQDDSTDGYRHTVDPAAMIIAAALGVGVLLLIGAPLVEPVPVAGAEVGLPAAAAFVFALGLVVGSGVYVRRGRRFLGAAHGVGAVGWVLVVLGTLLPSRRLLLAGVGVIVAGIGVLGVLGWRGRS